MPRRINKTSQDNIENKDGVSGETLPERPSKKRERRGNPAMTGKGLKLNKGDNTKFLSVGMEIASLPRVDLHNADEVIERLNAFFRINIENDLKPTVSGMAMALGVDRRRLWEIRTGAPTGSNGFHLELPQDVVVAIKNAYMLMENMWENYMLNGKINPVSGIFLGKNNFGYKDQSDLVVTPKSNNDNDYSAEDIKKRYVNDYQKRLSEAESDS